MLKKLLNITILLIGSSIAAFLTTRIIPADPKIAYLNTFNLPFTEENIVFIEKKMGLDIPVYCQYFIWLKNILNLNFGSSYINGQDVYLYLKISFIYTFKLMLCSIFFIIISSFFLALILIFRKKSFVAKIVKFFSLISISIPKFWLAFILIEVLGVKLAILPISGAYSKFSLILPTITLSISYIGYYTQFIYNNISTVLNSDFIKYAKLRKVNKRRIILNYALPNAMIPIITSLGKTIGNLLSGAVIVENIFAWPGLGRVIVEAIEGRDYPMIQGYILIVTIIFIVSTELSNFFCYLINPILRSEKK